MEQDEVQYYYDSSADKWWYFDTERQSWLPWQDEQEGEAHETAAPAAAHDESRAPAEEAHGAHAGKEPSGVAGSVKHDEEAIEQTREADAPSYSAAGGGQMRARPHGVTFSSVEDEGSEAARSDEKGRDYYQQQESDGGLPDVSALPAGEDMDSGQRLRDYVAKADASDRVRDMLARLTSTTSLEEAITNIAKSGSGPLQGSGGSGELAFTSQGSEDDNVKRGAAGEGGEGGHVSDGGDDDSEDDEDIPEVKHDSFVRRSTRMLTFKDKGGLAGCLKEAAKQRKSLIEEAGGFVPGTEEHRQEEWKRRARQLASQTHARAQRRWLDAARMASGSAPKEENEKITSFSALLERIRKKPEDDGGRASALAQLASSPHVLTVRPPPPGALGSVDTSLLASNLLMKPELDLREQRRRSSGFAGGQQGYVRFADATFRDPNYQLQMQELLSQQAKRKDAENDDGGSGSPHASSEDSRE
ncbi:hypothetical protein BESB_028700 [Besnoitia besnoiti]|uniref:Uncharacterized protein n=1 Tax=Besnoitia besnoiti TaxID=94643 RepID=A0A2A9M0D3_BESBE|nr:uncharacterized protein BESB_028700 [Besnoitia besnoiti]PFH31435.1 hypothetical protein BESB_028700 [Besnoitia besnoiti]